MSSEGIITIMTVTAANIDERESLWDIIANIKGLIGEYFRQHTPVNLQTPARNNMPVPRGKDGNRWIISTRRLVETVIAQLTEQFNIKKIRARDLWHLTSRTARKILAHNVTIRKIKYRLKKSNIALNI